MTTTGNQPLIPVAEPVSRAELVASRLRTAILAGQLAPGEGLVERDLAELLRVSKTPIREALRMLANTGLVATTPFRGSVVRAVDQGLATAIYEVRLLLEPEAVRLSTLNANPTNVTAAHEALAAARLARNGQDIAALSHWNRRFHHLIAADCGNPVLLSFLNQVQDLVALISTQGWRLQEPRERHQRWKRESAQHAQIYRAVKAGDGDTAAGKVREHVTESLDQLLQIIPADPTGEPDRLSGDS